MPAPVTPRRRTAIWVGIASAVAILVVVVVIVIGRGGGDPGTTVSPSGAPSSSVTGSSGKPTAGDDEQSAVPSPSLPSSTVTGKPTVVPTQTQKTTSAPLDEKGELGNGVIVEVTKIEDVKGEAEGPGEVAGPAIRVTVTVKNTTEKAISMDLALVNVYYGKAKTPASVLSGPGAAPLAKPIEPGKSDSGAYVFSVPKDGRNPLSVEFSYTTDAPTVIFSGTP